ncbi:hypothetical protein LAD73_01050 [Mycoplasma sp. 1331]|uniref:Uncharacterized protein n=1 Tax=Mycoplasma tauri TaxID=547987 RepID=A0A953NG88_9MOLU|nr:hypothetical protein [Mycoplasma tauri]MBZ4195310.1 hypothetical protein [Mycoplasma tauri]
MNENMNNGKERKNKRKFLIIGISIGLGVVLLSSIGLISHVVLKNKRQSSLQEQSTNQLPKQSALPEKNNKQKSNGKVQSNPNTSKEKDINSTNTVDAEKNELDKKTSDAQVEKNEFSAENLYEMLHKIDDLVKSENFKKIYSVFSEENNSYYYMKDLSKSTNYFFEVEGKVDYDFVNNKIKSSDVEITHGELDKYRKEENTFFGDVSWMPESGHVVKTIEPVDTSDAKYGKHFIYKQYASMYGVLNGLKDFISANLNDYNEKHFFTKLENIKTLAEYLKMSKEEFVKLEQGQLKLIYSYFEKKGKKCLEFYEYANSLMPELLKELKENKSSNKVYEYKLKFGTIIEDVLFSIAVFNQYLNIFENENNNSNNNSNTLKPILDSIYKKHLIDKISHKLVILDKYFKNEKFIQKSSEFKNNKNIYNDSPIADIEEYQGNYGVWKTEIGIKNEEDYSELNRAEIKNLITFNTKVNKVLDFVRRLDKYIDAEPSFKTIRVEGYEEIN